MREEPIRRGTRAEPPPPTNRPRWPSRAGRRTRCPRRRAQVGRTFRQLEGRRRRPRRAAPRPPAPGRTAPRPSAPRATSREWAMPSKVLRFAHLGQVEAGAEMLAFAAEDERARLGRQVDHRRVQLAHEGVVDGVASLAGRCSRRCTSVPLVSMRPARSSAASTPLAGRRTRGSWDNSCHQLDLITSNQRPTFEARNPASTASMSVDGLPARTAPRCAAIIPTDTSIAGN